MQDVAGRVARLAGAQRVAGELPMDGLGAGAADAHRHAARRRHADQRGQQRQHRAPQMPIRRRPHSAAVSYALSRFQPRRRPLCCRHAGSHPPLPLAPRPPALPHLRRPAHPSPLPARPRRRAAALPRMRGRRGRLSVVRLGGDQRRRDALLRAPGGAGVGIDARVRDAPSRPTAQARASGSTRRPTRANPAGRGLSKCTGLPLPGWMKPSIVACRQSRLSGSVAAP